MLNIVDVDDIFLKSIGNNYNNKIEVLIMCGGLGTRLKVIDDTLPKPLISINKLPILFRQLITLYYSGITNVGISINEKDKEIFLQYLKDFSNMYYEDIDLNIHILTETDRLGTIGILYSNIYFYKVIADKFAVIMGDLVFNYDINNLLIQINLNNKINTNECGVICLSSDKIDDKNNLSNYSVFNKAGKYQGTFKSSDLSLGEYVGLGIYVFDVSLLFDFNIAKIYRQNNKVMIDDDILPIYDIKVLDITGIDSCYVIDVGNTLSFYKTKQFLVDKEAKLNNRKPAVFLDRDGIINYRENRYVSKPEDMKIIPSTAIAIKKLNDMGIKVFVVTNQSGMSRGYFDESTLEEIHKEMNSQLKTFGAYINCIKYCEDIVSFRRKPNIGMFLEIEKGYNIDLKNSIMIGDEDTDKEAGENAGILNSYKIDNIDDIENIIDEFIIKYKCNEAAKMIIDSYENNKLVLAAGNGGSNSDASHITTELLKGFINDRYVEIENKEFKNKISESIPIINLGDNVSFMTAFSNDIDYEYALSQLIYTYSRVSDLFIGITTSGTSKNIVKAAKMAKLCNMKVIILTSNLAIDKEISKYTDLMICSKEKETYKIQEEHIKYYHYICKIVDEYLQEVLNNDK